MRPGVGFALVCCAAVASGAARAGDTCCGPPIQAGYPSWSPDGSTIAFQFKDDVWLARPDGGGLRALTQDGRGREPVWSPDGRRIAFVRINFSFQTDGGLYVVNADGSGARRIAEARTEPPSWSPDGSRVAYVGPGTAGGTAVYVTGADGSDARRIADGTSPDWSPDGTRIAFVGPNPPGEPERGPIATVRPDGSDRREVANGSEPTWSPDGRRIAYTASLAVHVVGADGSGDRNLAGGLRPVWSPDGGRLAYVAVDDPNVSPYLGVWVVDPGGGKPRRALPPDYPRFDARDRPAWSPDGTRIAAAVSPGLSNGSSDLYVAAADGSGLRRVTPAQCTFLPRPCTIAGTAVGDTIVGTRRADVIWAYSGSDRVLGGAGNDRIYGGEGEDDLSGGPGNDTIYGGPDDSLFGLEGRNLISGGPGNDTIYVRNGATDIVDCGPGRDLVLADASDIVGPSCERVVR